MISNNISKRNIVPMSNNVAPTTDVANFSMPLLVTDFNVCCTLIFESTSFNMSFISFPRKKGTYRSKCLVSPYRQPLRSVIYPANLSLCRCSFFHELTDLAYACGNCIQYCGFVVLQRIYLIIKASINPKFA